MKKKLVIGVVIAIVAVIAVAVFSIFYLPAILPRATTLNVSPQSFTLSSGESIVLVASLTSDGITLSGSNIKWKTDSGSFDKTVGPSVIYRAPEVDAETVVTITVEFPGEGPYQPSKVTITGKILPKEAKATTLTIIPSTFEIISGEKISLRVEITPKDAPADLVKWSLEGPGTLTSITGQSTTYMAPEVDKETSIKIVVEFPGTKDYGRSVAEVLGKVLPKGAVVKKATTIVITPTSFTTTPSGEVKLTAELRDLEGKILTGKTINWRLEGPGTLSSTTGLTITYRAPAEVKEEATVKIIVEFPGDEEYLSSRIEITGKITPKAPIAEYAYILGFGKAVLKNIKIEGPLTMFGTSVTKISGEIVEVTGLTLQPMGLKSEAATFKTFEIYTIELVGQSPELGKKLEVSGDTQISMTRDTLTLEEGHMKIVYATADSVELVKPEFTGKYVGGEEPYIPVIVTAHQAILKEGYLLEGPKSYEELSNKVNKLTAGKVEAQDFTFIYPSTYSLNRMSNEYSYTGVWRLSASKLTGQKILVYLIYFEAKYGGIAVKGSGEETASQIIPHGFNAGYESPPLPDAGMHAVHFTANNLGLEKLVLQITL
ncbi:MAG: hypothetical protein QXK24_07345 [Ignisphaera sp.]